MHEKLKFAAEVLVIVGVIAAIQMKFMNIPIVGEFLPGYTARA